MSIVFIMSVVGGPSLFIVLSLVSTVGNPHLVVVAPLRMLYMRRSVRARAGPGQTDGLLMALALPFMKSQSQAARLWLLSI
jgi:hypothetical protein